MEITSNAQAARLLSWALRKHTFISYALYTAGAILSVDCPGFVVYTASRAAVADANGVSVAETESPPPRPFCPILGAANTSTKARVCRPAR